MPKRVLLLLLTLLAGNASATGEFYCCQDSASGRRVCGDTLPDVCRGHSYRILDRGGNVLKEVGPPLSAEQKAQVAEETRRKKLLEEAAREQRRRDQALLDTYATLEDIDLSQRKAETDVGIAIENVQRQMEVSQKKRHKLADEAEFYKKRNMPPQLASDLRAIEHEIKLQQELLEVKRREYDVIKAKYDADRKRYIELTGRRTPTTTPAANGALPPR